MKNIIKFLTVFISCLSLLGCKTVKNSDSVSIKGNVDIVTDRIDENINSGGIVKGYVYSKVDKKYIEGAIIEIDNKKYYTNEKGYFNAKVNSGTYKIAAIFIGHTSITINNLKVEEKHNLDIRFELGTQMIICK
ncbi:carboxypeptidase-like regulatory domain-containing protein [Flavobacterium pedocola]